MSDKPYLEGSVQTRQQFRSRETVQREVAIKTVLRCYGGGSVERGMYLADKLGDDLENLTLDLFFASGWGALQYSD